VRPPLARPLVRAEADGEPLATPGVDGVALRHLPRSVVLRW
jgi:hypothetical protein